MQLKSSLISFNHYFDSPVIPTTKEAIMLIISMVAFLYHQFAQHLHNIYFFVYFLYKQKTNCSGT